jgi:hypothetical protein
VCWAYPDGQSQLGGAWYLHGRPAARCRVRLTAVSAMQRCPICDTETPPDPRYPEYVCRKCLRDGVTIDGVLVPVSEIDVYSTDFIECEVSGVSCYARRWASRSPGSVDAARCRSRHLAPWISAALR